ncbi:bifunctional diguanylate cyclase/phosphodiesterase [Asanoa sp. WMMD1127]|uniref:putative bifunctional diguanylate cyclase/phosphodiesterase n=1 Tax=Asanoa sp. WMMD1127 TaxID=3016107 RepID=UPI0024179DA3|nr:bifunctional diguanylate cyclase/phosphodiesterase [Asanoa sp. WMMD1127]MDG4826986.1 bifunctional diguanylate cyclase/phosphodiesterase [Asanoa sp. WMMD1127]
MWARRRPAFVAFNVATLAAALAVLLTHLGGATANARDAAFWVMVVLAVLAGLTAFAADIGPERVKVTVAPTVCFTFAILLTFGLWPAAAAQAVACLVIAWRLGRTPAAAVVAAARYTLALGAASAVLWLGRPDPFRDGGDSSLATDALAVVAAGVAWLAVYGVLFLGTRLGEGLTWRRALVVVRDQVLFNSALLVLSPVLAFAALINVAFVPLAIIPLYAVQRLARLSTQRENIARQDPLTGLANRSGLRGAYDRLILSGTTDDPAPTLLVLDLDRFKQVNDALGHDIGDHLLIAVAKRLPTIDPHVGVAARLGGDEFAILARARDPRRLAEAVVRNLNQPVYLEGLRVDVTASVGLATDEGEGFATLLRHADVAMYEAKQHGDMIAAYDERADRASPAQLSLLADFRRALEVDDTVRLRAFYQPQVSLRTGRIEGVEALLRWNHPQLGPIRADEIVALAEHTPVMVMLTRGMIDRVTAQVATWNAQGVTLRAALNVSTRDLYSDELIDHLAHRIAYHEIPPGQIQIELTESAILADVRRAQAPLRRIADLGVTICLDDFGTGYSSLQHLRRLPISEIKIDKSFIAGMAHNSDDAAIVRSTIELARSLHIRTVAEGVEDDITHKLLAKNRCDLVQGWHTARPMPGEELPAWLDEHKRQRRAA